jgi:hypothetical protein
MFLRSQKLLYASLGAAALFGILVGRWLLKNNGPCTVDYGLVAAWIGALSAAGLLAVAIVGTKYAYQTAKSAIEALRLESEPMLLADVDVTDEEPQVGFSVEARNGELVQGSWLTDTSGLPHTSLRIRIRNVGRRPAYNIMARILLSSPESEFFPLGVPFYIQALLPNEHSILLIQNRAPSGLLATVNGGTQGSISEPGTDVDARIYRSNAFPMPF